MTSATRRNTIFIKSLASTASERVLHEDSLLTSFTSGELVFAGSADNFCLVRAFGARSFAIIACGAAREKSAAFGLCGTCILHSNSAADHITLLCFSTFGFRAFSTTLSKDLLASAAFSSHINEVIAQTAVCASRRIRIRAILDSNALA